MDKHSGKMTNQTGLPGVYFVAGPRDCREVPGKPQEDVLLETARLAALGGAHWFQLRHKPASTDEVGRLAQRAVEVLSPLGVTVIINDDYRIAKRCRAHGVHLGQSDPSVWEAREQLGEGSIIGLSVENDGQLEDAARLYEAGVINYVGLSPVFPSRTKTDTAPAFGIEGVRRVRSIAPRLPMVAIGGIKARNASEVVIAGAECLAVVSEISRAEDPTDAARRLVASVKWAREYQRSETVRVAAS